MITSSTLHERWFKWAGMFDRTEDTNAFHFFVPSFPIFFHSGLQTIMRLTIFSIVTSWLKGSVVIKIQCTTFTLHSRVRSQYIIFQTNFLLTHLWFDKTCLFLKAVHWNFRVLQALLRKIPEPCNDPSSARYAISTLEKIKSYKEDERGHP